MAVMDRSATTTTATTSSWPQQRGTKVFVDWEEVIVSNNTNKGRKEVHYYLKRRDGGRDLAVVGKERSLRHMSYYYALRNRSLLLSLSPSSPSSSSLLKLRSRTEVVHWLSSIVSDSPSDGLSQPVGYMDGGEDDCDANDLDFKDFHLRKLGQPSEIFSWLGSAWTCRKRRQHYKSFCRNGIKISVHDFVYVMAEENKKLVAYLEDLYEDPRGNKMVVVRWFHQIDEVGIVLPPNYNDREIFSSLCLQDLSVECIDGLATILSPQHFEKYMNEATQTLVEPFVCHRQVDNDDVKPFDITQVQGYWKQEILRYIYTKSSQKTLVKPHHVGDGDDDVIRARPKKRLRGSKDGDVDKQHNNKKYVKDAVCMGTGKFSNGFLSSSGTELCGPIEGSSVVSLTQKEIIKQSPHQQLAVGSHVEVLSQDSGIRGCWFRAVILKREKNKLKVQYQDIKDAVDEAKNLEEWVLASRVAVPDETGLRICGRATVRPHPPLNKAKYLRGFDVGSAVDAWWYDGWWEGIVVNKESEDRIHVYFPGEQRSSMFGCGVLRCSQDWVCNKWNHIKERPDLVSGLEMRQERGKSCDGNGHPVQVDICDFRQPKNSHPVNIFSPGNKSTCKKSAPCSESQDDLEKEAKVVPNLAKDDLLSQLKWKSSKKRRRGRESLLRRGSLDSKQHCDGSSSSSREDMDSPTRGRFLIPNSLKVDHENCKYGRDPLFSASRPPLSSLVMSR